jgi:NDP-sugar pyrophosphorylase family protein
VASTWRTGVSIGSVLLAAGRGERLRPLTDRVPKPTIPVGGIPLGAFALSALARVRPPVVVNTSHLAEMVVAALEPFADAGTVEFTLEQPRALGTAGTLRALRHRVDATLLTMNADLLTDLDLRALLHAHREAGAPATLAVRPVPAGADLAVSGSRAIELIDRHTDSQRSGALYLGAAAFEPSALQLLDDTGHAGLAEALLRPLVARTEAAVFVHTGYALDVGTPERLEQAVRDVEAGRGPPRPRRIDGSVH